MQKNAQAERQCGATWRLRTGETSSQATIQPRVNQRIEQVDGKQRSRERKLPLLAGGVLVPDVGGREILSNLRRAREAIVALRFWVSDALGVTYLRSGQWSAGGVRRDFKPARPSLSSKASKERSRNRLRFENALDPTSISLICAMQGPEKPR